jgi:hypothetical protein
MIVLTLSIDPIQVQSQLTMTSDLAPYSFRTHDQRFQKAVTKLFNIAFTNPRTQSDAVEVLRAVARQFTGETFGAPNSLQRERQCLQTRLKGFHKLTSPSYQAFQERGLSDRRFPEIVSIIEVLADYANLPMDRECKRRKSVLFGWADRQWHILEPLLPLISLEFDGGELVNL